MYIGRLCKENALVTEHLTHPGMLKPMTEALLIAAMYCGEGKGLAILANREATGTLRVTSAYGETGAG